MGLISTIKAIKGMKGKGTTAVLRLWVNTINDSQVNSVLMLARNKGMSPIDISLVKRPTVEEMSSSGEELPAPVSIEHSKLDGVDEMMRGGGNFVLLFRDYELADEDTRRYVLDAFNRGGFTGAGKWPSNTLLFMVDEGKSATELIDLPAESL